MSSPHNTQTSSPMLMPKVYVITQPIPCNRIPNVAKREINCEALHSSRKCKAKPHFNLINASQYEMKDGMYDSI
jgi:hypothetical protein